MGNKKFHWNLFSRIDGFLNRILVTLSKIEKQERRVEGYQFNKQEILVFLIIILGKLTRISKIANFQKKFKNFAGIHFRGSNFFSDFVGTNFRG